MREKISKGKSKDSVLSGYGLLRFWDRIYIPSRVGLKEEILEEGHTSKYTMHPAVIKIYHDLTKSF